MDDLIAKKIKELKKQRDAVILAHNYTIPEVQDIADFTGDSLELSKKAAQTEYSVILFCGVKFMAETAKILNPVKKVLMPDNQAGCPMADMITAEDVRRLRQGYPEASVVCYVNSSAGVKAESDICCTSANAVKVVESIPKHREVIFIPDKYLGRFVSSNLKRQLILWDGYCHVHLKITPQRVLSAKKKYPDAMVLVHPECTPDVIKIADMALSTGQMLKYMQDACEGTYLIGTENGMIYPLSKVSARSRIFSIADDIVCSNMKLNTLEKIFWALEDMKHEIVIEQDVINLAKKSLEAMIRI